MRLRFKSFGWQSIFVASALVFAPTAQAAQHVTLRNGFELDCTRQEAHGDHVRLYLASTDRSDAANYMDVANDAVVRVETVPDPPQPIVTESSRDPGGLNSTSVTLTSHEMDTILASAGTEHNIDADLLASVVKAESGGRVRAVSRVGAQGLMQLMPTTAQQLGVENAFAPKENINGGTAYLDMLLNRYHNNVALALAAYNAGPAAVDRYHGIPPYAETRAYVARVIREFNRRKRSAASHGQAVASK
ncbi:MAG TPA: lytic transglycosylase domain-containing protein [Edaphobacter sp.]|nr:lytic transglycosylase domain-containing protein [Edaphobacter sp.]